MQGKTKTDAKINVSVEVAENLLQEGWKKVDLHVHSSCSYDVPPVQTMHPVVPFEKAKSQGLDYVIFIDHDTVKAYDLLGWDREGLVPGVEISIKDADHIGHTLHVNVFELDSEEFNELELIANQEHNFKSLSVILEFMAFHICIIILFGLLSETVRICGRYLNL